MGTVLGIIVLIVVIPYLANRVQQARNAPWAGPQTPAMRGRAAKGRPARSPGKAAAKAAKSAGMVVAHPGSRQIRAQAKADAYTAWQQAFATDYLEQQRHNRANGTAAAGGTAPAPARRRLRERLRLRPFTAPPQAPGDGGSTGTPPVPPDPPDGKTQPRTWPGMDEDDSAPGDSQWRPSWQRKTRGSPAPDSTPQQPVRTNGGTTMAGTSTAAAQKMIEGITEIQAHANAGGIHAKREALAATREGATRLAAMVQMLARQMSEPGQNYGPEITEPLAKSGQMFNAGATTVTEADNALETLINMTLGDVARSPRQAPHHRELSENSSR